MAINIVIFASGSGSNAENLIISFRKEAGIHVSAVFCNNPKAFVIERAKKLEVPCEVFDRKAFKNTDFLQKLRAYKANMIVLAGFLWKIPPYLIEAFPEKIINIHPALLPKYGGKGMYGENVHRAVIDDQEKESGISIHLVNENYDEGRILYQARCKVDPSETPDSLAKKIHELEYRYFPEVVADYIRKTT